MPPPPSNAAHVNSINHLQMQLYLGGLKKNATDLRKQLTQLRKTQVKENTFIQRLPWRDRQNDALSRYLVVSDGVKWFLFSKHLEACAEEKNKDQLCPIITRDNFHRICGVMDRFD